MRAKRLFVTVDAEGDALWSNPSAITTENAVWIPAFQVACERYGLKPIYLTTHEMILDERFARFARVKVRKGLCEIGLHVHAQNSPPLYTLPGERKGGAYLVEYPPDVMRAKIEFLKAEIEDRIEEPVLSHRAGRWNLNQTYVDALIASGIRYDCSVTPGVDWRQCAGITPGSAGADHRAAGREACVLKGAGGGIRGLVEYPVTIVPRKAFLPPDVLRPMAAARALVRSMRRDPVWLRPRVGNTREMRYAVDARLGENADFLEFMIHSSELMPGGSPQFPDASSIRMLYGQLDAIFSYATQRGFEGGYFFDMERESHDEASSF